MGVYLTSVIIYMIIIYSMTFIFGDTMKAKGWAASEKPNANKLVILFCLSAVPILRIFVLVSILYMATHTKEEFDKWQEEAKKNKSHEN